MTPDNLRVKPRLQKLQIQEPTTKIPMHVMLKVNQEISLTCWWLMNNATNVKWSEEVKFWWNLWFLHCLVRLVRGPADKTKSPGKKKKNLNKNSKICNRNSYCVVFIFVYLPMIDDEFTNHSTSYTGHWKIVFRHCIKIESKK